MKTKKQIISAMLALAAAGSFATSVFAGESITYGTTAAEYTTATDIVTTPADAKIVSGAAVVVSIAGVGGASGLVAGDKMTFTLSGGATFDSTTLAANLPVIGGLGVVAGAAGAAITNASSFANSCVLATATPSVLTCTVQGTTDNNATAANNVVTVTIPAAVKYDMTSATADTTITAVVTGLVLGQNATKQSEVVTSVNAVGTTATALVAVTTASKTVFNVNAAEQKGFALTAANDKQATVGFLFKGFGDPAVAANLNAVGNAPTASTKASTYTPTGKFLYTLTGLPTAANKIVMASVTGSDAAGATKTAQNAGNFWLDGAGKAYATLAAGAAVILPANAITITMDGTTPITAGDINVGITYIPGAGDKFKAHTVVAPTKVISLTRNGSSFSVNAAGALNTIKITDMSGSVVATTGKISVVGYKADGTVAPGTQPVIAALTANGTRTIAMSALTTAFPAALRFDFVIESTEIIASNVKKTGTGTTVTTYRNSATSGTL